LHLLEDCKKDTKPWKSKVPNQSTVKMEERIPSVNFVELSAREEKSRELSTHIRSDEQSFIELTLKEVVKIHGLNKLLGEDKAASTSQVESMKGLDDRIEYLISVMKGNVLND